MLNLYGMLIFQLAANIVALFWNILFNIKKTSLNHQRHQAPTSNMYIFIRNHY